MTSTATALPRSWTARLRSVYRSAGWPFLDTLELELLAAGLLERIDDAGTPRVRLSDAGIAAAVQGIQRNRAALSAHEALVQAVVTQQQRSQRLAYTGLGFRVDVREAWCAQHADASADIAKWVIAQPDVFSMRNISNPAYLRAVVHEVKVKRADVLGELKRPLKTAAYLQMASEVWMVLGCDKRGSPIATPDELPASLGVLQAWPSEGPNPQPRFEVLRSAPHRTHTLGFAQWMVLAKSRPHVRDLESSTQLGSNLDF